MRNNNLSIITSRPSHSTIIRVLIEDVLGALDFGPTIIAAPAVLLINRLLLTSSVTEYACHVEPLSVELSIVILLAGINANLLALWNWKSGAIIRGIGVAVCITTEVASVPKRAESRFSSVINVRHL